MTTEPHPRFHAVRREISQHQNVVRQSAEDWATLNDARRESLSQAVGRAVFSLGFEGLLTQSAQDRRGRTLTFFPENLSETSQVDIEDATELDRWLPPG